MWLSFHFTITDTQTHAVCPRLQLRDREVHRISDDSVGVACTPVGGKTPVHFSCPSAYRHRSLPSGIEIKCVLETEPAETLQGPSLDKGANFGVFNSEDGLGVFGGQLPGLHARGDIARLEADFDFKLPSEAV